MLQPHKIVGSPWSETQVRLEVFRVFNLLTNYIDEFMQGSDITEVVIPALCHKSQKVQETAIQLMLEVYRGKGEIFRKIFRQKVRDEESINKSVKRSLLQIIDTLEKDFESKALPLARMRKKFAVYNRLSDSENQAAMANLKANI